MLATTDDASVLIDHGIISICSVVSDVFNVLVVVVIGDTTILCVHAVMIAWLIIVIGVVTGLCVHTIVAHHIVVVVVVIICIQINIHIHIIIIPITIPTPNHPLLRILPLR
jgi:hypothetical protein